MLKKYIRFIIIHIYKNKIMDFATLIMSTMNNLFAQVFDIANNSVLKEWGLKTVENIADKALQNMPHI
ncbi:MAG TPA: hypothetical protein VLD64_05490 [Nitrosarchaeum sp.]|nr:hypothetical protein [Nitrosarchaeum sp.]